MGNKNFSDHVSNRLLYHYRVTHETDIFTYFPSKHLGTYGWSHPIQEYWINSNGIKKCDDGIGCSVLLRPNYDSQNTIMRMLMMYKTSTFAGDLGYHSSYFGLKFDVNC